MRPSGETKEAVQLVSRSGDSLTWSSHAGVILAPKFCRTAVEGKLSKVHIPSLAVADRDAVHAASNRSPRMESSCYRYPSKPTRYCTELEPQIDASPQPAPQRAAFTSFSNRDFRV